MANLNDRVNKHNEQIDALLTTTKDHTQRIETLETREMAMPPSLPAPAPLQLPKDIATNASISKMLDEKIPRTTPVETITAAVSGMPDKLAQGVAQVLEDDLGDKVKEALHEGIHREFAEDRQETYRILRSLDNRMGRVIDGQWWLCIPRWVFVTVGILILGFVGFGYGFYYQWDQSSKLKDVEWLYRRERAVYNTDESRQRLINRERDFITGTPHEQDSIKNIVHYWEHKNGLDKTFTYYAPSEE